MVTRTAPAHKAIVWVTACGFAFSTAVAVVVPAIDVGVAHATTAAPPDKKLWQAVAPGRVEPLSGEIGIAAPVIGRIGEVLANVNDKVFAGEPLLRLEDDETQARLLAAQAQVALRTRARNEQRGSSRAASRREAEDAVAVSEQAVFDAWSALDKAVAAKKGGAAADVDEARAGVTRAQDHLKLQKAELDRRETELGVPLPNQTEGQLNVARAELLGAQAAVEKLTIRAPIDGTVLHVSAKPGELAMPSAVQPLLLLGDISAMRVRAEVDERDFGGIKIGQAVVVRSAAFREREFAAKVRSIAPIVQPGRISLLDRRNLTDVSVAEVVVDLADPGPLTVGMKVDVYFRHDNT